MKFESILLQSDTRGVATLTLDRPDKHNSMNAKMIAELAAAAEVLGNDKSLRAVVLTGAGASFCAGGDLEWMRDQFAADRGERLAEARKLAHALRALNELPLPLIGRINGQAYGGGMGLISICDVAVATATAKFGFTEARLGLIPATISPYCIARMGEAMTRRVFMSARLFDAVEAQALGIVAKVAAADDLDQAVEAEVKPYLSCAPGAVAAAKALARSLGPVIDETVIEATTAKLADSWETSEAVEGITAFLDKRKPSWIG